MLPTIWNHGSGDEVCSSGGVDRSTHLNPILLPLIRGDVGFEKANSGASDAHFLRGQAATRYAAGGDCLTVPRGRQERCGVAPLRFATQGPAAPLSAPSPPGVAFGRRNGRGATLVARSYLFIFKQGGRPSPFNLKLETSCGLVPQWARPLPPILHPLSVASFDHTRAAPPSARLCRMPASQSRRGLG